MDQVPINVAGHNYIGYGSGALRTGVIEWGLARRQVVAMRAALACSATGLVAITNTLP